ncbi:hypothetical protein Hanom_Chr01g00087441 [Helianthus anomalus]
MEYSGRRDEELEVDKGDASVSKVMGEKSNNQFLDKSVSVLNSLSAADSSCYYFGSGGNGETRRKGKGGSVSLGSPVESRPKKRVRAQLEKDDLFGLDDLIQKGPFPFQNNVAVNDQGIGQKANDVDLKASLDLNMRNDSSPAHHVAENSSEIQNEEVESGVRLIYEVVATIKLRAVLGIDLQNAEKLVKDSIGAEGINGFLP